MSRGKAIAALIAQANDHKEAGRWREAGLCYLEASDYLEGSTVTRPMLLEAAFEMHDRALEVEHRDQLNAQDPRR